MTKTFPGDTQHTCLLNPDRDPMTCTDTTQGQLDEPICTIGVAYRSRTDSKSRESPKATPAQVTAHGAENLQRAAQPAAAQSARERPSSDLNLFQEAQLDSASSGKLAWSVFAALPV